MKFLLFLKQDVPVISAKGFLGIASPSVGIYVSLLPKVEAWLRVISALVGIAVGITTMVTLLKHKKNGDKNGRS